MKLFLILIVAVALAAPGLSGVQESGANAPSPDELKSLPPLNLQDFRGKSVRADQFKGSVVVLDFWATWCAPCISEIPALNRLQQKYGEQGVRVVGVTLQSGEPKEVRPFIERNKMKYTILMGDDEQMYDLNVFAFPTTLLLTRDMKVFRRYLGAGPRKAAEMEADIQKLLATTRSSPS